MQEITQAVLTPPSHMWREQRNRPTEGAEPTVVFQGAPEEVRSYYIAPPMTVDTDATAGSNWRNYPPAMEIDGDDAPIGIQLYKPKPIPWNMAHRYDHEVDDGRGGKVRIAWDSQTQTGMEQAAQEVADAEGLGKDFVESTIEYMKEVIKLRQQHDDDIATDHGTY